MNSSFKAVLQSPQFGILCFCLTCLSLALFSALGWMNSRQEALLLSTELQFASSELRNAQQQLEAERLIGRRQLEMIREAQSKTSTPTR